MNNIIDSELWPNTVESNTDCNILCSVTLMNDRELRRIWSQILFGIFPVQLEKKEKRELVYFCHQNRVETVEHMIFKCPLYARKSEEKCSKSFIFHLCGCRGKCLN